MFKTFARKAAIRKSEFFKFLEKDSISNVMWQDADGSWSRGFFAVKDIQALTFNYSKFEWVNKNKETFEEVEGYFNGVTPDKYYVVSFSPNTKNVRAILNSMPSSQSAVAP